MAATWKKIAFETDVIAKQVLVTPITGEIIRWQGIPVNNAAVFTAKINSGGSGGLTATNVPYDADTNEHLLNITPGATSWGRIMLYNSTRQSYRKVSNNDTTNNKITTDAGCWDTSGNSIADNWADNDDLTTQSQTNAQAGYFDVDLSANVPTTATAVALFAYASDLGAAAIDTSRRFILHPYTAYSSGTRIQVPAHLLSDTNTLYFLLPCSNAKITMMLQSTTSATILYYLTCRGYI